MGEILQAYMVLMSETLKTFFRRLNQGFHKILVNKCQVSNAKPQAVLLRKVADNVIFHTNKLRHEEDKSEISLQMLNFLNTLSFYV